MNNIDRSKINHCSTTITNQLQWACRRGMLELDVLLGYFLQAAYPQLKEVEQAQFVQLLSFSDPELFAWLLGQEEPPVEMTSIVKLIRQHARARFSI